MRENMENEILYQYAKQHLFKYGLLAGIFVLLAGVFKFTPLGAVIDIITPTQISNFMLVIAIFLLTNYANVLLDISTNEYVEVDVESVHTAEDYGEVITVNQKHYYFDRTAESYQNLRPCQLTMVVTRRCHLPVKLLTK